MGGMSLSPYFSLSLCSQAQSRSEAGKKCGDSWYSDLQNTKPTKV